MNESDPSQSSGPAVADAGGDDDVRPRQEAPDTGRATRRARWATRTARLGAFLYRAQPAVLLYAPAWMFLVRGAVGMGWYMLFYILYVIPAVFVGQLIAWRLS